MTSHPNRSAGRREAVGNPLPDDVRAAREASGLTQTAAAAVIYSTLRTWQDWESGSRRMHPAMLELFLIKTARKRSRTAPCLDKRRQ